MINHNGREYIYIYIYISESLCYTAEIKRNIVNQLYFNKIKKKKYMLVVIIIIKVPHFSFRRLQLHVSYNWRGNMPLETYVKKVRDAVLAVKLVDDYVSYHHVPVD